MPLTPTVFSVNENEGGHKLVMIFIYTIVDMAKQCSDISC